MKMLLKRILGAFCLILLFLSAAVSAEEETPALVFGQESCQVLVGRSVKAEAFLRGTDKRARISYTSDAPEIASVSNGTVRGIAAGETVLRASVALGETTLESTCTVRVTVPVNRISLEKRELVLPAGVHYTPAVTVFPEEAGDKAVEYKSSDEKRVRVEKAEDGTVSLAILREGRATVTCSAADGSGIKTDFTVAVPELVWFSPEEDLEIDSPEGANLYYIHTFTKGIRKVSTKGNTDSFKAEDPEPVEDPAAEPELAALLEERHLTLDEGTVVYRVRMEPRAPGYSLFSVIIDDSQYAKVRVNTKPTAFYESFYYADFAKKSELMKDHRYILTGTVLSREEDCLWLAADGDQTKLVRLVSDDTALLSSMTEGQSVSLKGRFTGLADPPVSGGAAKVPELCVEYLEE